MRGTVIMASQRDALAMSAVRLRYARLTSISVGSLAGDTSGVSCKWMAKIKGSN